MEDNNRVKPNEWLVDSPKEKVIKQNDDCSAYLERYKFELWERRIGRCLLFVFLMLGATVFFYYGLTEGIEIISNLSEFLNNSSTQNYSTINGSDFAFYPVVICSLFLILGLTLALILLRVIYRQSTDKKKEIAPLLSDFDPNLRSSYRPSKENEIWVSFRGQFGVNPLNSEVSKKIYSNINDISKL